jgi:hypothetical protein
MTYLCLHSQNWAEEELDGGGVLTEEVGIADKTEMSGDGVLDAEVRSADEVVELLAKLEVAVVDIEVSGVSVLVVVGLDV